MKNIDSFTIRLFKFDALSYVYFLSTVWNIYCVLILYYMYYGHFVIGDVDNNKNKGMIDRQKRYVGGPKIDLNS